MAMVSIGESRWRMLRRIELNKVQPAPWADIRSWSRKDIVIVSELIELGLVKEVGRACGGAKSAYSITAAGSVAARLGELDADALSVVVRRSQEQPQPAGRPGPRGGRLPAAARK